MDDTLMKERLRRVKQGDLQERERLIEENIGLVRHIVKRFAGRGADSEDLFQIGCIGLVKAVDKFDLSFDVRFSTYAVPMIQGELQRFLRDDGMVKVSRKIKEQAYLVHKVSKELTDVLGREPTLEELEKKIALSREEIVEALESCVPVESIYGADGELSLVDRLTDEKNGGNEENGIVDRLLLQQLLSMLEKEARTLIYLRYFDNRTQSQVADCMGISQVQVSRMEKKILTRLRDACHE